MALDVFLADVQQSDARTVVAGEIAGRFDHADSEVEEAPGVLVSAFLLVDDIDWLLAEFRQQASTFKSAGVRKVWVFQAFDDPREVMIVQELDTEEHAWSWTRRGCCRSTPPRPMCRASCAPCSRKRPAAAPTWAAAFVTTKEDPEINQPTIDYVATFVPDASGEKFNPHVTIGIASQDYLNKMLDEKFETFTFSPAGAAVYHLGNFGTARKELKSWKLQP